MREFGHIDTPLGALAIDADDVVRAIRFSEDEAGGLADGAAARQLREYFDGKRREFALDLDLNGTEFQRAVWSEVAKIAFGETRTYLDIARALGDPNLVRAVGAANGANPVAIVIPCHRVVGTDGSLTGYAGGLSRKRWLLDHERGQAALPW